MMVSPDSESAHVVRVIARLNVGGPSIHVAMLNDGLRRHGFSSTLVAGPSNPGEGTLIDFVRSRGVEPVELAEMRGEASLKFRDAVALVKLVALMRRERPQIVHTHTMKAGVLGRIAAKLSGVPVVVHTYHGHVLRGYYGPLKESALRWLERRLASVSDAVIAISPRVRQDLIDLRVTSGEKIEIISLGFDLQPFLKSAALRGQFRRSIGCPAGVPLIGIVGRIFPIKNHRLFLDAATRVHRDFPDARFVIVGDGLLRADMEAIAAAAGLRDRVIFTGWRTDLPAVYADLDLLAVSSINEGTPVSAIESMASGVPVVATAVGGVPDIVQDGETGRLVEPGDGAALADAIVDLLRRPDDRMAMGQEAARRMSSRFHADRLVGETAGLYRRLLNKKLDRKARPA